jgi:hypothetical protein
MLGQAFSSTVHDLAHGLRLVALGVIAYFLLAAVITEIVYHLRGGRDGYERREAEKLPAELAELERQHREEIRCMGGRRHLETPR